MKTVCMICICMLWGIVLYPAAPGKGGGNAAKDLSAAFAFYRKGDLAEARKILLSVISSNRKEAKAHYYLALIHFEKEEMGEAEKSLLEAINCRKDYADAYSELAAVKIRQKKVKEAVEFCTVALAHDGNHYMAHMNLSNALLGLGNEKQSLVHLAKAAVLRPESVAALGQRFETQDRDLRRGLDCQDAVLAAHPTHVTALLNSARILTALGRNKDALERYRKAYDLVTIESPTFDVLYNAYLSFLVDQREFDLVETLAFAKVEKEFPPAWFFVALARYRKGDLVQFTRAAKKFFACSDLTEPPSLTAWVEEILKKGAGK